MRKKPRGWASLQLGNSTWVQECSGGWYVAEGGSVLACIPQGGPWHLAPDDSSRPLISHVQSITRCGSHLLRAVPIPIALAEVSSSLSFSLSLPFHTPSARESFLVNPAMLLSVDKTSEGSLLPRAENPQEALVTVLLCCPGAVVMMTMTTITTAPEEQ